MSCPFFKGCLGETEINWDFSENTKKETIALGRGVYSAALTSESAGDLIWTGRLVMAFTNRREQAEFCNICSSLMADSLP